MTSWADNTNRRGSIFPWVIALVLIGAAFLAGSFVAGHSRVVLHGAHECLSPCTVTLPDDTQEDQFGIDYGWRGKAPVVDVFTSNTDSLWMRNLHLCIDNPAYTRALIVQCMDDLREQ